MTPERPHRPAPHFADTKTARTVKERARNAAITGTAGGYLGGMLVGGKAKVKIPEITRKIFRIRRKTMGVHGARTGALIGALVGATNKGKRSDTVDSVATGGDWKFGRGWPQKGAKPEGEKNRKVKIMRVQGKRVQSPGQSRVGERPGMKVMFSAYVEDMTLSGLPKDVQADVTRFVDAKKDTPLVHYGMTLSELLPKADPSNLMSARKNLGTLRASRAAMEVINKTKDGSKYVLLMNDRVIDGHHFLAKAERGKVSSSLNVLDLTPARLITGKVTEFEGKPFAGYNAKRHARTGGLNDTFRKNYNREHGSDLKRPVTTAPSKLKTGSKAAKRRASFCARMGGMQGATSKGGELTPKGAALKRWNCESGLGVTAFEKAKKEPESPTVVKARYAGRASGMGIGAVLGGMLGAERGAMASGLHGVKKMVDHAKHGMDEDFVRKVEKTAERGQTLRLSPEEIDRYERLKSHDGKQEVKLLPGKQAKALPHSGEGPTTSTPKSGAVKAVAQRAKWKVQDAAEGALKYLKRPSMSKSMIGGGLLGAYVGGKVGERHGHNMVAANKETQAKMAANRVLKKAAEIAKVRAIADQLYRQEREGRLSARQRLTAFAEEKNKPGWKRKAVIAAGGTAALTGAALMPGAVPMLRLQGRRMLAEAGKGKGLKGRIARKLGADKAAENIHGKTVTDYLDAAQGALNRGVPGKIAGHVLQHAQKDTNSRLHKKLGRYGVDHYARFRAGHREALGHWDYEVDSHLKNKGLTRVADKLGKGREKVKHAINSQLWQHGKNEAEALRAVGRDGDKDIQDYFRTLSRSKDKVYGSYAKKALLAPTLVAGGTATVAAARKPSKEKKFARVGGQLVVFETPGEKRNRVRDLRDKIGLVKDVAGAGAMTAAGVGSVKGYRLLKKKTNDPEVRKLVKYGQVLLRTWNKAGKATAQGAKNMSDVAAPGAALVRGGKAVGKAVAEPFLKAGRAVRTWMHHDPRPVQAFASKKDRENNQRDAKIVGGSTAAGALIGANYIGGRQVKEGEKLKAGVRYVRRHGGIPLVQHEGIGTGQARVAEVSHDGVRMRGDAATHIVDRKTFAKNMPVYAIDKAEDLKAALRARQGAKQVMGKKQPFDYCIKGNNCQHWTEAMRTGIKPRLSRQVRNIGKGALLAGGLATAGVAAARARKEPKKTGRKQEFMVGALLPAVAGTLGGAYAGSKLRGKAYRAIGQAWRKRNGGVMGKWGQRAARVGALATENGLGVAGGAIGSYVGSKLSKPKPEFSRIGGRLVQFGGRQQLKKIDGSFPDPLDVFIGREKAYNSDTVKDYHAERKYVRDVMSNKKKGTPESVAASKAEMERLRGQTASVGHAQVGRSLMKKADTVRRVSERGGGLIRDAVKHVKGEAREKDAWGRTKKREWEKPWFQRTQNQVAAAASLGGVALLLRSKPKLRAKMDRGVRQGQRLVNKYWSDTFPNVQALRVKGQKTVATVNAKKQAKAKTKYDKTKAETKAMAEKLRAEAAQTAAKNEAVKGPEIPGLKTGKRGKTGKQTKMARNGGRLITLADPLDVGWDIRDARGRSARVFAPEAGQRDRRPKRWHERVENERKLWGAAALTGTLTGAVASRKLMQGTVKAAVKAERNKIRVALQKVRKIRAERQPTNIHTFKPEQPMRPGPPAKRA
jgi:hypothetical protein